MFALLDFCQVVQSCKIKRVSTGTDIQNIMKSHISPIWSCLNMILSINSFPSNDDHSEALGHMTNPWPLRAGHHWSPSQAENAKVGHGRLSPAVWCTYSFSFLSSLEPSIFCLCHSVNSILSEFEPQRNEWGLRWLLPFLSCCIHFVLLNFSLGSGSWSPPRRFCQAWSSVFLPEMTQK